MYIYFFSIRARERVLFPLTVVHSLRYRGVLRTLMRLVSVYRFMCNVLAGRRRPRTINSVLSSPASSILPSLRSAPTSPPRSSLSIILRHTYEREAREFFFFFASRASAPEKKAGRRHRARYTLYCELTNTVNSLGR